MEGVFYRFFIPHHTPKSAESIQRGKGKGFPHLPAYLALKKTYIFLWLLKITETMIVYNRNYTVTVQKDKNTFQNLSVIPL